MDLGFGDANQIIGQKLTQTMDATTRAQEAALDDELDKYDELLQDEDALELLRERRLEQLKKSQSQFHAWRDLGHGVYSELDSSDVAKAFFEAAKQSERLVVHFYRPTTRYCDVYHKHLEILAQQHLETKFVKINVDRDGSTGVAYLVEKLGIHIMPTVLCVKNRKAVHHVRGLSEVGGEDCETVMLAYILALHGVLTLREEEEMDEEELFDKISAGVNAIHISRPTVREGHYKGEEDL